MLRLRAATRAEFRAFAGREPPEAWYGQVADSGGAAAALGSLAWHFHAHAEPGAAPALLCWASVDLKTRVPAALLHRAVLKTLKTLRSLGEPAVYCGCDPSEPGATRWLARLGFVRDPAMTAHYRQDIWRWS